MTQEEIKHIWRIPKYLPYIQPTLTEEILQDAEKQIGFKLPKELVEILKIQNGGYIRYKLPETTFEVISGIGKHFPSLTNFDWSLYRGYVSFELNGLVPIDGDGHWYICLDYRNNQEQPEIWWIDVESDTQTKIADTFAEFLEFLVVDIDENLLVIETENSLQNIAKQIESILQIKFDDPDIFSHGYSVYRSRYKDSWIWLTPNKVPSGFIREDEDQYNELKEQMNTWSVQHHEICETSLFLQLSEKYLNSEVVNTLTKNNINIKRIMEVIEKNSSK